MTEDSAIGAGGGGAVVLGKAALRVIAASILILFLLPRLGRLRAYLRGPVLAFVVFFCLAAASISYAPSPFISAFRLLEHLSFLFFGIALCMQRPERTTRSLINLVLAGCLLLLGVVWIAAWIAPDLAYRRLGGLGVSALGGHMLHIHTVGIIAALVFSIALKRALLCSGRERKMWLALACFMFITMLMARSRTSLVISVLTSTITFIWLRQYRWFLLVGCVTVVVVVSGFVDIAAVESYVLRGQHADELRTLSARTQIWDIVVDETLERRPILGFGYQMMSEHGAEIVSEEHGFSRGHAHNTFLQTFAGLGIAGLGLLAVAVMATARAVWRRVRSWEHDALEVALVFVICIVSSITEFGIVGFTTPVVPAWSLVVALMSRPVAVTAPRRRLSV